MPDTPVLPKPQDILGDGKKKTLPSPTEVFNAPDTSAYANVLQGQESKSNFDSIINNIEGLDEGKKQIIKDVALKGATRDEIKNSILTLQGAHPHQDSNGSIKYYIDDKGLPIPLKNNERPPQGHEVASIWGTQKEANDDAWYTDLAKTVYNILPSSAENVVDLAQTAYEGVTGKESENLNALKNSANYLKFAKDEDLNKSLFNTSGISEWSDLLDKKRLDFSPEAIWGTVNGLLGSVGEFAVGGSGAGKVIKGIKGVEDLSKVQAITANVIGSTLTNLGEVRDAATEAGLTGRDRALFVSAVAPIISAVDVKWGLGTKMFGNSAAKEEKMAFLKALGKGIPRDAEGKITKEGIDEFAKVTTAGYTQVAKKLGQLTATDVLAEGGQEAGQQFIQNASEQLWDKLTPDEKKKFGTDAFSPESFAEYIQNGLAGLVGGTPTVFAYNKAKTLSKQEDQNNNAFEIAKGGEAKINSFKANVDLAVKQGSMTKEEADNALLKVNTYKEYYDQTLDSKLDDKDKKRVFELTFEKANLESQIPTEYEKEKLNGIEQAKIDIKEKHAKEIQKELNSLFEKDELLKKETTAAKKTIENLDKELTPKEPKEGEVKLAGTLQELYNKHAETEPLAKKVEVPETRNFEEIPFAEWNQKRDSQKFKVLAEHLDKENIEQVGQLKLMKGGEGEITNDTVHIKLPNNKWVILASSATDTKTKLRGHLHIENLPKDFDGHSVVIKPHRLTTGRVVLPVYNAETGKHVGYVREDNTGKANEKLFTKRAEKMGADKAAKIQDTEIEELQHLKTVKLTKNEIEAIKSKPIGEVTPSAKEVTPKVEETQPKEEKIVKENNGKQSAKGLTTPQKESTARNNTEISSESTKPRKAKALKTGTKRAKQRIVDPVRLKALEIESDKPYDLVQQYFIKNGHIKFGEIFKLFNGSKTESNKRFSLQKNDAPTIKELAHQLWEGYSDLGFGESRFDTEDFRNAIEEVLNNFHSRTDMAKDLNRRWEVKTEREEEFLSSELSKTESEDESTVNKIVEEAEKLGNDEITDLANDQTKFDIWGNPIIDIFKREEGDEDVFQNVKVEKGNLDAEHHEKLFEITKRIQSALPNVTVQYDPKLKAAGRWSPSNKTITINPYYAGLDTPIHEAGHVLIDVMGGMENTVIRKAVEQLKGTELYKQTKERYPELNEQELGYEVLAEAIGREGERIFDKEIEKNVFMKYLDYIFNRLKQLFGIDKNIAKSLASQIIGGISTKNIQIAENGKEQFQQPKKKFTPFEEKTKEQQIKALTLSFEQYSRDVLKRDVIGEADKIQQVNDKLDNPDITEKEKSIWEAVKKDLQKQKKQDLKAWFDYREDMKWAASLDSDIRELQDKAESKEITEQEFLDGMIELYNVVNGFQEAARKTIESNIKLKLADALKNYQKKIVEKNKDFNEAKADKADIRFGSMMNLGHASEKTLELQSLSKIFDTAQLDKATETREKKNTYEKLAKKVIEETNKKLGVTGLAKSTLTSDSVKYFDYMDNGSGELLTLDEAKEQGLSDAQIEFLKYQRELIAEHKGYILDDSVYNMNMQVLKTDPTFWETYKAEGILQAFSNFLGTNYNIKQVRIEFTNPLTKEKEITEFSNVEKALLKYGEQGYKEKAIALALLVKYNVKAKKQLRSGVNADEKENPLLIKNNSQFSLNNNGILSSQFDKPRDKTRGYSKDFYRAGISFIDDAMHVKYMSKIVAIADSIKYMNETGIADKHGIKPNVAEFVKDWMDLHLYKNPKQTSPEIDIALKFIRGLTSATTMMFNVPAGAMNLFMGIYSNWRAENSAKVAIGHKRLFGEIGKHKIKKDYAYGSINPYAVDILRMFDVVSNDFDSNPKFNISQAFTALGHALTRYGEFQIQGSMFLGLLSKEDYDSFEYKTNKHGIDELVVKKDVDLKALKDRMIAHKNRVSDIQGKYSDKDRRNVMNGELGKAVWQFKVWMPDFILLRFGQKYIDVNGKTREGSWNTVFNGGLTELKKQIKSKGFAKTFFAKDEEMSLEAKNIMSNIKGLMAVTFFWALANQSDDDKKRRKTAIDAQNALSQLLFVLDPNTLKWTATRPIAALGTVEKMINVVEDIKNHEAEKFGKDVLKLTPANKVLKVGEVFE